MFIIYLCRNRISNKFYVGFTSKTVEQRRKAHEAGAANKKTALAKAITKYGKDSFEWTELFLSWDREFCLEFAEQHLIETYDSMKNGYNMIHGGHHGPKLCGSDNGMFGKTHSDAVKRAQGVRATQLFSGKSYAELYGEDAANRLKTQRSEKMMGRDNSATKNPRFDKAIYTFVRNEESFTGTRYDFYNKHEVSKASVCMLLSGKRPHVCGWSIL